MESNEMILIHTVEKFVKAAQNDQYLFDCLPDFLSALKEAIKHDASIKSWGTDTDFDRIAAAFIANHAYDLLSANIAYEESLIFWALAANYCKFIGIL